MKETKYKKLDVDLPKRSPTDSRPWQIAGWLVVLLLLLLAVWNYYNK